MTTIGTIKMTNKETLKNAISELNDINSHIKDKLKIMTNKEEMKKLRELVRKNESMILDYQFRLEQK